MRIATCCLLMCTALAFAQAQQNAHNLTGHWSGAYVREGSVQAIEVDFTQREDSLSGVFQVPDLSIYDEPITVEKFSLPNLGLKMIYGSFILHLNPEYDEITGQNAKWNPPVYLHLKRSVPRPKHHSLKQLTAHNGSVNLAATLFLPNSPGKKPLVIVIPGSGDQDRNSQYYRSWGPFFSERGVAALLYDKRGVGASSGSWKQSTFAEQASDVEALLASACRTALIDCDRAGVVGISQGGWLAEIAATRPGSKIHFVILDVGPATSTEEQELDSIRATLSDPDKNYSKEEIEQAEEYTKKIFQLAYAGGGWSDVEALNRSTGSAKWTSDIQLVQSPEDLEVIKNQRFEPADSIRRLHQPLLAFYGGKDSLVPGEKNAKLLKQFTSESHLPDATIVLLPRVNHDKETFNTLFGGEWKWPEHYWVWGRKDPRFFDTIVEWMTKRGYMSDSR